MPFLLSILVNCLRGLSGSVHEPRTRGRGTVLHGFIRSSLNSEGLTIFKTAHSNSSNKLSESKSSFKQIFPFIVSPIGCISSNLNP